MTRPKVVKLVRLDENGFKVVIGEGVEERCEISYLKEKKSDSKEKRK